MLVMSKGALTAAKAETYYEEKYSHDDYYSEKQQVVGQWFGHGAQELGLSGEIATEDFRAVLRGRHPAAGRFAWHAVQRSASRVSEFSARPQVR